MLHEKNKMDIDIYLRNAQLINFTVLAAWLEEEIIPFGNN